MKFSSLWMSLTLASPKVGSYLYQPLAMVSANVFMSGSPFVQSHGRTDELLRASTSSCCLFLNYPHFVVPPATGWPPTLSLVLARQSDFGGVNGATKVKETLLLKRLC